MSALPFAVRPERPDDAGAIAELTRAAFRGHPHSQGTEAAIVEALRSRGQLHLSLVAADATRLAGHIAFSPVRIDGQPSRWLALGPVSVLPDLQGRGIGRALIREGLARIEAEGFSGCVLVGDPAVYTRFGFSREPRLRYSGAPAEYFLALAFADGVPAGEVSFDEAFAAG